MGCEHLLSDDYSSIKLHLFDDYSSIKLHLFDDYSSIKLHLCLSESKMIH